MGQINSSGLTNIIILVVRYFGGRLLGVSGLINAYRSAAASAIANGEFIEMTLHDFFELEFPYQSMNDVMKVIKDEGITQSDQKFEEICRLTISFRKSSRDRILNLFSRIAGLKHTYTHTF